MNKKMVASKIIYPILALCILVGIVALACTPSSTSTSATTPTGKLTGPQTGGILKMADGNDGSFIGYPPKLTRTMSSRQASPAIETLLRFDISGKPIPWLASDFVSDINARTITLTLQKGVKFHDGSNFNADAVKWNLDQCKAAKTAGTEKINSTEVINDNTVRVNLTVWDSTFTSNLAQTMGMIISPTAYKTNGEEWCANNPIGTGPYKFVSWQKEVKTSYTKFADYWQKGKPYLDGVEWIPVVDSLTRELGFRAGDFDVMLTQAAKGLSEIERDGFVVIRRPVGAGAKGLVPNSLSPNSPFSNLKVRQAAQYAIDSDAIAKALFFNEVKSTNQPIYVGNWGFNSAIVGYPYDPTKAKQLLAEAGFANGFKTKLSFGTSPENNQVYTAVQGYLKVVGIDAELDQQQVAWYNRVANEGAGWDGLAMGTTSGNPDIVVYLSRFFMGGKSYAQMVVPDDYAKAVQNAAVATTFESKQKYAQEAMKLMIDKYDLLITIYNLSEFAVSNKTVHDMGVLTNPSSGIWYLEDTWMDKKK